MTRISLLALTLIIVVTLSPTIALAGEWFIFGDELPAGASLELRADSMFEIGNSNPFKGTSNLEREMEAGAWAWITGIMDLGLDITGINFDEAYVEFYIDSGSVPIDYVELRVSGPGWEPDNSYEGAVVDNVPGYEKISVMLKDFNGKQLGHTPTSLAEFTGGTNIVDRWSLGFSPPEATTMFVDEIVISDGVAAAVSAGSKLSITWGSLKAK